MLYTKAYVEKAGEKEGVLQDAVITSELVDRENESISQRGLDFKNFLKNPILLWSHNAGADKMPAIGKVSKVWQTKDGYTHFTPVFDLEDDFAKSIYRKFKSGFLNAFSIGFIAKDKDEDVIKEAEVLEFSAVNIPANPEALVELREQGMAVCKDFKEWKKKQLTDVEKVQKYCKKEGIDFKKIVEKTTTKRTPKADEKVESAKDESQEIGRTTRLLQEVYTQLGKELRKINKAK